MEPQPGFAPFMGGAVGGNLPSPHGATLPIPQQRALPEAYARRRAGRAAEAEAETSNKRKVEFDSERRDAKQKRMIKNRDSAARSRARKQVILDSCNAMVAHVYVHTTLSYGWCTMMLASGLLLWTPDVLHRASLCLSLNSYGEIVRN